jgi:hypothetical protein
MKSSSKSLALVSVMFVAFAGGCALLGYDLSGYGPATSTGSGGAGAGGGATSGEGGADVSVVVSVAGSGGAGASSVSSSTSSSATSSTASATSSTASGMTCPMGCNDNDPCTTDDCKSGMCSHMPTRVDDGNACTQDTCDKGTGMPSYMLIPNCCAHSACVEGNGPLDPAACSPVTGQVSCVAAVCEKQPACCKTRWDADCVALAHKVCVVSVGSSEQMISCKCAHSYCMPGAALDSACDPCVNAICQNVPSCCTLMGGMWDQTCINATTKFCGIPAGQCQ